MPQRKKPRKRKANPLVTVRHKERKQKKHQTKLLILQGRKIIRDILLEKAKIITKLGSIGLKRLVGTLNIHRLTDIVENKYFNAPWYLLRQKKVKERKPNEKKDFTFKDILAKISETMSSSQETKKKNKKRPNERISKG